MSNPLSNIHVCCAQLPAAVSFKRVISLLSACLSLSRALLRAHFSHALSRSIILALLLSLLLSLSLFRSLFLVHALPLFVALALLALDISLSESSVSLRSLCVGVRSRPSLARSGRLELTVLFAGVGSSAAMATEAAQRLLVWTV